MNKSLLYITSQPEPKRRQRHARPASHYPFIMPSCKLWFRWKNVENKIVSNPNIDVWSAYHCRYADGKTIFPSNWNGAQIQMESQFIFFRNLEDKSTSPRHLKKAIGAPALVDIALSSSSKDIHAAVLEAAIRCQGRHWRLCILI